MTKNTWTPRTPQDFQRMGYAWKGDGSKPRETRQMRREYPRIQRRRDTLRAVNARQR